ncbi:MAG: DUF4330 domain-containing protein [Butyricicoccaceae bacterium]
MKIINEKGKLFGLINIVDLLVLIAAVAVAAGVGYKLFAPQIKESVQPQVELTAIVRVRGATPFLVTEVERNSQVGKQLVSGNSYVNGTIEDMKIEDATRSRSPTADGRIVTAVDPDKKDIVFTIKTTVPKGTATPSIGTQEVRAGRTFIVKTNDFETSGNIDSVDIAE